MNLPYARLTCYRLSPHLQTKIVAHSLTIWTTCMVHSILNIYKTPRAKIPYMKAPLFNSMFLMLSTLTDILFIDTTA